MRMLRSIIVAASVIGAGCSGDSTGNSPPATLAVSIEDNVFTPASGSLRSAGEATWTWNGTLNHDVVFEDGQGSSTIQSTGTHSRTFPTVSSSTPFRYRCTLHSADFATGMVGQVVVSP